MKKLLISAVAVASLFASPTVEELQKQINDLQTQLKELKANQENTSVSLQQVKQTHYEDHINFHFGIRSSIDFIHYKTKSGKTYSNNILSNRVTLTGLAKVDDNLKATLKIEANNIFGMNGGSGAYDNSNWTANETPDDTTLRVKEAFFNYFFGEDGEYMFSAGRRPAVGGYPANLREGDAPTSPVAHLVNMEFDGFSLWFKPDAMGSLGEEYGTNIKFCFGRGYSSNTGKFNQSGIPYKKSNLPSMDMGGFLLIPYNDDQYSVWWENIYAVNVQGAIDNKGTMDNLGDYFGTNIIFKADGVGEEISDFLDETKAFISFAYTKTDPDNGKQMLGETSSKSGYSVWVGADMPFGEDGDRFGVNIVHGSKYYRAMTYGEDTLVGSIAAVRGTALDAYIIHNIKEHLTASLRATYISYSDAGSEAFFGVGGNPDNPDYVEKASDIRAYIRYEF
jgi:outer membrane murein-binding lipoprotein Lpp